MLVEHSCSWEIVCFVVNFSLLCPKMWEEQNLIGLKATKLMGSFKKWLLHLRIATIWTLVWILFTPFKLSIHFPPLPVRVGTPVLQK